MSTEASPTEEAPATLLATPAAEAAPEKGAEAAAPAAGDADKKTLLGGADDGKNPTSEEPGDQKAESDEKGKESPDDGDGDGDDKPTEYGEFEAPAVPIDQAALDAAIPVFQEMGLDQEGAQKLINLQGDLAKAQMEAYDAKIQAEVETFQKEPSSKETLAHAKRALDYATPEERAYLEGQLLGDNVTLIKVLGKLGKALAEDTPPSGDVKSKARTASQLIYSNSDMTSVGKKTR